MRYDFLIETYATERMKVLSVWTEFRDTDLEFRPRPGDPRGRSVREQMIHQCVSEDLWFRNMLKIDVAAPPLPQNEQRAEFIQRYAEDSGKRLQALASRDEIWYESEATFFDVKRSNAWVLTRRISHSPTIPSTTARQRAKQRPTCRSLCTHTNTTPPPTAKGGALMQNHAPTI